jgi:hypothetical protein
MYDQEQLVKATIRAEIEYEEAKKKLEKTRAELDRSILQRLLWESTHASNPPILPHKWLAPHKMPSPLLKAIKNFKR